MNEKDRDRSGDGDGPVALQRRNIIPFRLCSILTLLTLFAFSPFGSFAQKHKAPQLRGLSLVVDAGVFDASNVHANFYNGAPDNVNTLSRILYSETYGNYIWNNLTTQDLIGSSITNYRQITVAEYGDMYYKVAFQLGFGIRYDYDSHWGWLLRADYVKLRAQGMVLLNSGKTGVILSNKDAYVSCPAMGEEERIYIDLGLLRSFKLHNGMDLEVSAGLNVNNTKVASSKIRIAGVSYSILDVWGGQSPSSYVGSYEYVNQGGIGYGGFASISTGFTIPSGTAMTIGYTFHYNKVVLAGYTAFAPHHAIKLTVAINNFSFFD